MNKLSAETIANAKNVVFSAIKAGKSQEGALVALKNAPLYQGMGVRAIKVFLEKAFEEHETDPQWGAVCALALALIPGLGKESPPQFEEGPPQFEAAPPATIPPPAPLEVEGEKAAKEAAKAAAKAAKEAAKAAKEAAEKAAKAAAKDAALAKKDPVKEAANAAELEELRDLFGGDLVRLPSGRIYWGLHPTGPVLYEPLPLGYMQQSDRPEGAGAVITSERAIAFLRSKGIIPFPKKQ